MDRFVHRYIVEVHSALPDLRTSLEPSSSKADDNSRCSLGKWLLECHTNTPTSMGELLDRCQGRRWSLGPMRCMMIQYAIQKQPETRLAT